MYRAIMRLILRIKYWRAFRPAAPPTPPRPRRETPLGGRIVFVLLFIVPETIGLGFGYLSWIHGVRIAHQIAVDRAGIAISATVEGRQIEEIQHRSSSSRRTSGTPAPSYFCHLLVSYRAPGSDEILRKAFRFEDDTICTRYEIGETITGKLLPDQPDVMVLDEGRLNPIWLLITLTVFGLFSVLPLYLVLRRWLRPRLASTR